MYMNNKQNQLRFIWPIYIYIIILVLLPIYKLWNWTGFYELFKSYEMEVETHVHVQIQNQLGFHDLQIACYN